LAPDNYGGSGPERQNEIYLKGLFGERPAVPLSSDELERAARAKLPAESFDYVAGGAGSGSTMRANLQAFDRWQILPKMLTNVTERDYRVQLMGRTLPAPVLLGPVGVLSLVHVEAEIGAARAAASLGLPFVLSNASSIGMEEVASAAGAGVRWFQLYFGRDKDVNASLLSRAESAGYEAVVVTLDTRILGWRDRDLANGFLPFLKGEGIGNFLTDPVFKRKLAKSLDEDRQAAIIESVRNALDPSFGWKDFSFIREHTKLPVLVKGVLCKSDAQQALDSGADGIVVSNHGGRQVDGSIASLDALPEVVEAVGGKVPVLLDGGIRKGADAVKALALGADAILLGRLYVWGLALNGEEGVRDVTLNFLADLDLTLALSGIANLKQVDRSLLRPSSTPA